MEFRSYEGTGGNEKENYRILFWKGTFLLVAEASPAVRFKSSPFRCFFNSGNYRWLRAFRFHRV